MKRTHDRWVTHTDALGKQTCWRVRIYAERELPVAVVVVPVQGGAAVGRRRLLEIVPREGVHLLKEMERREHYCWWVEHDGGEVWAAAHFDRKSVTEVLRGDLDYLPAWMPVERSLVETLIAPHRLEER